MVRVALVQSRFVVGGHTTQNVLLAESLSKNSDHEPTLIGGALLPGENSGEPLAHDCGLTIEHIPEMQRSLHPYRDYCALRSMERLFKKIRPDVVHTHTAKAGALGRVAAKRLGVPVIVHTFHGHVFQGYFGSTASRVFVGLERALAKISDAIVVLSDRQKWEMAEYYRVAPADKIHVIPLGLSLEKYRRVRRAKKNQRLEGTSIDPNAPLILTAGRFVPVKRFDRLIDAFSLVLKERPDVQFAIAGGGAPLACKELERLTRPYRDRIHLLGWRSDMDHLLSFADVFALGSDNEGTPTAVIEALAAGVPVVATDVGGIKDLLTDDRMGCVVQVDNTPALARTLLRRISDPQPLPDSKRDEVVERFSQHRLNTAIAELYDALAARNYRRQGSSVG